MSRVTLEEIVQEWVVLQTALLTRALQTFFHLVLTRLLELSPVDKGKFRQSWYFAIGSPGNRAEISSFRLGEQAFFVNTSGYAFMIDQGGWKPPRFRPAQLRPIRSRRGGVVSRGRRTTPQGFSTQAPEGITAVINREAGPLWQAALAQAGVTSGVAA